jgi:hypothetical protein
VKRYAIDLILLVVIAVGGVYAWPSVRELSALRAEHARLTRITGKLTIGDPSKIHLQAIDTGDAMNFAWRVYLPANYTLMLREKTGSGSSWNSEAQQFIARVGFRENKDGVLLSYTHFAGGSGQSTLGQPELARFLHGRWNKLKVEQLGRDGTVTLDTDKSAVLLRITLPEDM